MARPDALAGVPGVGFAWGPSEIVNAAVDRIRRMKDSIGPDVFERYLSSQKRLDEAGSEGGCTVIIAAIGVPAYRIGFSLDGREGHALLPPTYAMVDTAVKRADLAVKGAFCDARPIRAPFKTIAVALGLAEYGRNGLAYVDGYGSYVRLRCYLAGEAAEPSGEKYRIFLRDGFDEDRLAPACRTCGLCISACPTGALSEDRFVVQADSCATHYNENPGLLQDRMAAAGDGCLMGCMRCQEACPMNEGLLEVEDLPLGFSDELTRWLIDDAGKSLDAVPPGAREVLDAAEIGYMADVLSRNVSVLYRRGSLFRGD